jgi:hypothetical protein
VAHSNTEYSREPLNPAKPLPPMNGVVGRNWCPILHRSVWEHPSWGEHLGCDSVGRLVIEYLGNMNLSRRYGAMYFGCLRRTSIDIAQTFLTASLCRSLVVRTCAVLHTIRCNKADSCVEMEVAAFEPLAASIADLHRQPQQAVSLL